MDTWRYFYQNGDLLRIKVIQDSDPYDSPRDWDGNVGHMMCWHSRYDLGDTKESKQYNNPEAFLNALVSESYTDEQMVAYVRSGKASRNMEIKYDRTENEYQLLADYESLIERGKVKHGILYSTPCVDWLADEIVDALPIGEKISMLERKGYFFLPLAMYEHSGITMWCGSRLDHFDAQWDCSDVGWIYTTKAEVLATGGSIKGKRKSIKVTDRNWKQAAEEWLRGEVEIYDMYLQGEVYGYKVESYNGDDFNEIDSCWGFYSKKWGDDLARELWDIEGDLYGECDADDLIERETEKIAEATMACFI